MEEGYVRLKDGSQIRVKYEFWEIARPRQPMKRGGEVWLLEDRPEFALVFEWTLVLADGSEERCVRTDSNGHTFTMADA